jgi:hypothetical protein
MERPNPVTRTINRVLYGGLLPLVEKELPLQKPEHVFNQRNTDTGQIVKVKDVLESPVPSFSAMRIAALVRLPILFAGDLLLRGSVRLMTVFDSNVYVPWESASVLNPEKLIATPKGLTPRAHLWEPIVGTFKDVGRLVKHMYDGIQSPVSGIVMSAAVAAVVLYHQVYSKYCKSDVAKFKLNTEFYEANSPDAQEKVMAEVQQRVLACEQKWDDILRREQSRGTFNDCTAKDALRATAQREIESISNSDPELVRLRLSADRGLTALKMSAVDSEFAWGILPSVGWSFSAAMGVMYGLPGVVEFCNTMQIVESPKGFVVFLGSVGLGVALGAISGKMGRKKWADVSKHENALIAQWNAPPQETEQGLGDSGPQDGAEVVV